MPTAAFSLNRNAQHVSLSRWPMWWARISFVSRSIAKPRPAIAKLWRVATRDAVFSFMPTNDQISSASTSLTSTPLNLGIKQVLAVLANGQNQVINRVAMQAGDSFDSADRHALSSMPSAIVALLHADSHIANRLGDGGQEILPHWVHFMRWLPLRSFPHGRWFRAGNCNYHREAFSFWASAYNRGIRHDWRKPVVLAPSRPAKAAMGFFVVCFIIDITLNLCLYNNRHYLRKSLGSGAVGYRTRSRALIGRRRRPGSPKKEAPSGMAHASTFIPLGACSIGSLLGSLKGVP